MTLRQSLNCLLGPCQASKDSCCRDNYGDLVIRRSKRRPPVYQLVLFFLLTNVLTCHLTGSQPLTTDQVPHGAASLAFVFDITGSMYDDLVQVIEGAAKILATTLARREKPLYNYVLVPFHDPEIGPVIVTTDPDKFQFHLRDIYVQGGGDCPEMTVGAVKKALEVSLPNSFIYVFTDARSKDYYLTEEVLSLIQQKQSQVVFVMTGDCDDPTHEGFRVYEQIASTSSGQVFLLKKSQVNEVLNFVRVAVQSRKVNLLAIDRDQAHTQVIDLPVDSHLQEFTVSVSGDNPTISLWDPRGNQLEVDRGYTELLRLKNVLIVNTKEPSPGQWKLEVTSTGPHTIRVTGLSSLDFVTKFARRPETKFQDADYRPIKGIPTHVMINSTHLDPPGTFTKLELVDLEGVQLAEFPISRTPRSRTMFNVSSFIPPDEFFYVKVAGVDDRGYKLQRTTPTAISPKVPTAPDIYMKPHTRAFYDTTAVLVCKVDSAIPFSVRWFKDGYPQTNELYYEDVTNVTLEVPRATKFSEGFYSCNASNARGSSSRETFLDVSEPPPQVSVAGNVSVIPGNDAVLNCLVYSTVQYNLTWYRPNFVQSIDIDPRITILNNGSLRIRNVANPDEGVYVCKASNEGGDTEGKVNVRVQVPPLAKVKPKRQNFVEGETITINCTGLGFPIPSVQWLRGGLSITHPRMHVRGTLLTIRDIRREDEGNYECLVINTAGQNKMAASLDFIERPRITLYEKRVLVAGGDTATLFCQADGIPKPTIKWFKGDTELQELSFVQITANGELLIFGTQENDAGDYRCVATNPAGADTATVTLDVGSEPLVVQAPSNIGADIEGNVTLPCSAVGQPSPQVSWRRADGKPVEGSSRVQQLQSGALAIRNIGLEDEGMYTCVVENQFGKKEVSAYLSITGIVRPLIAYTNPFVEVVEGRTLQLRCVVLLGNPKPTVTWLRDGRPVRGASVGQEEGQFMILSVQKGDEGEYTCLASNVGGNATYLVRVDVQVPPSLLYEDNKDRQTEFSVVQGASVTLPCRVTGEPKPLITWSKDGQPISATDPHYFITQDGSLEIYSTDAEDTARYQCSAKNVAGSVEKDVSLFVRIGPVIAGPPEEEITLNAGDSTILPCEVSGEPKPNVFWRKNFVIFRSDSENTYFTEEGLHIQRAEVGDKGIYECIASNVAGNNSKVITLMVQVPPEITSSDSTNLVILEKQPVVLGCETIGDPSPLVRWKKDNLNLNIFDDDGGYSLEGTGSLRISSAVLSDTGTYMCSASNPAGTVTREIRLTVQAPPTLPAGVPGKAEIIQNNPVILPCPARGTPPPIITWYRDGKEIHRNEIGMIQLDDGSLEIQSSKAVDTGRYKCVARNVAGNASHVVDLKILVPPKFPDGDGDSGKPDKPTVIENDTVTLECPALADPPPLITWFKNGQPLGNTDLADRVIISNDGRELTILRSQVTDTARFTCVAANIAGKTNKNFDLEVQVPPKIDDLGASQGNLSVIVARPLVIDCPVAGIPPPRVTWLKDGRLINPSLDPSIRTFAEGRRLELLSAKVTDTARFTCVAKNVAGSARKNFDLSVLVPPSIDDASIVARPEVISNQNIRLTCPASGIPRPTITWHKNKEPITVSDARHILLEDGWTLELRNTSPEDTARYTCRATNVAGQNEKVFDLQVLIPATIDKVGLNENPKVLINHTTTLRCPAKGSPSPTIRWYKNSRPLDPASSSQDRIEAFGQGRQLRINAAQLTDSGSYSCVVINKAGEDSMDMDLDVLVPARIDRFTNLNPTVIANETVIIDCPVSGVPPPQVTWLKDRRPVTPETHPHMRSLFDGRQLEVHRAQVVDSGRYTCRAVNEAGQAELDFTLKVQVPPTISNIDVDPRPSVIVNQSTVLNCPASGTPDPRLSWLRNGQALQFEREPHLQLVGSGRQLRIVQAKLTDAGQYTCIAINEAGQAEKNYVLDVHVPPRIDRSGLDTSPSVILTRSIVLQCPASGIPSPNIAWLKDERPLVETARVKVLAGGLQLQITNSQEDDSAKYSCVASNPAGEARLDFDLSVQLPPTIDESNLVYNPKVIVNRTVLLECPVSGIPPPQINWLIDGQPLRETPSRSILQQGAQVQILQAQVSDSARYTCIAFNAAGELQRHFNLEVLVPPHLEDAGVEKELSVIQNLTITIDCPVTGTPEPSVMWMKDREPLLDFPYPNLRTLANGKRLEISRAQVSDGGRYSCMATNVAGQIETSYKLSVQVPPVIEDQRVVEKLSVVVLEAVNLVCKVSGSPEPEITWLKDRQEVNTASDKRLRILDNGGTLQIVNIGVADAGRYTCRAQNQAGAVDKHYGLEVLVPPAINGSGRLHEKRVILQKSLTLECPAQGVPEPVIQWQKARRALPRYGSPSVRIRNNGRQLVIPSAQLLDNGTYTCVASNVAGNISIDYLVSVLVPPTIEDAPSDVSASVGSRTLLLCESVGLPSPVVAWTKDNELFVVPGERHRMHRSGTLEFTSAQVSDSGSYRCTAENEAGSSSREVYLRVEVPAEIEKDGPDEVQVVVGDEIILPCDVKGTPRPRVYWQKGTAILTQGPGMEILENGSLRLGRSQLKDSGVYICIAQNNAGTDTHQLKLDVLVSPTITADKRDFVVRENRDILLPCRSSGQPPPQITWQKDGVEISVNNYRYRTVQSGWLVIPVARAEDAGIYTCVAKNKAGQQSIDMTLEVQVPPRIDETSRIVTIREGGTASLPCKAHGFPTPQIKWRKNGRRFRFTLGKYEKADDFLVIQNVQPADTGRYRCIATNLAGKDTNEISLRVQVPPSFKVTPRDTEVSTGGRLVLHCEASGIPVPSIRWQRNGEDVPSPPSVNGRSKYTVRSAYREDAGRYTCIAENPAGIEQTSNTVLVKVPPNVIPQGNRAVTVAERVVLSCSVGGDPAPTIFWTKNGRPLQLSERIQQLSNGSLVIYQSTSSDAGEYKCVASNDAGTSEGTAMLTVRSPPQFKIEPKNQRVSLGDMVTFDCVAEGEPEPAIEWRKVNVVLETADRVTILPNNSLRIVATQPSDSGLYRCLASNNIGRVLIEATLTVVVHGMWSGWTDWGTCSQSCGQGLQLRTRSCNNPEPSNGGRTCIGAPEESKTCVTAECPVDGEWGNWLPWEECSVSCGAGERVRRRLCDNPHPQFGGASCEGDSAERVACNVKRCPIDGNWGGWGQWEPCSVTCGSGKQVKHRSCDSPRPQYGGRKCRGRGTQRQRCVVKECGVDGNWGKWSQWSSCTLSCGGGTHLRTRKCDSPAPQFGGTFCPGQGEQTDFCNVEQCPVNGNWSPWNVWGDCTTTCGGGQRKRFRTCTNPPPTHGGRACVGPSEGVQTCNAQPCPINGDWSAWGPWSSCTKTCDTGSRERQRVCRQPRFGGRGCLGDSVQVEECNTDSCYAMPLKAFGSVIGNINGVDFGVSQLEADMNDRGDATVITGTLNNVPREVGYHLRQLLSVLSPIYWTTAHELGGAYNGYTLTKGEFKREIQVEFTTGEILKMTHIARGVDSQGVLQLDIIVRGTVPSLPEFTQVHLQPYTEDYIQTGLDSIYAHSSRLFRVDGYMLPYAWNHTITYNEELGTMPFLVQRLFAHGLEVEFQPSQEVLRYRMEAQISPGEPSNMCPTGFLLEEGKYCKDEDECSVLGTCSDYCHNTPGSYSCSCPIGFILESDGKQCSDIDECLAGELECPPGQDCLNTIGSFQCVVRCADGFRRTEGGLICEDINECEETPGICSHECTNTVGGYQCSCRPGYQLVGRRICEDINECVRPVSPCSHSCQNNEGSYQCSCPLGYILREGGICRDIDECAEGLSNCGPGQQCSNTPGSFQCIDLCPPGFQRSEFGSCQDIDECTTGLSGCYYNQACENTQGSYRCICPRGYRSYSIGEPCLDIDECQERPNICSYHCKNTFGSFECICPPGQKQLADKKSCAGLEFLEPARVLRAGRPIADEPHPCTQPSCDNQNLVNSSCPPGYTPEPGTKQCQNVDECSQSQRCQHNCTNTPGSYRCICPPGYRLHANQRTCLDIDECQELKIKCGPEKMCFNRRGDFTCIDIPCPRNYKRDPLTNYCVLECEDSNIACPLNSKYADVLQFKTLALPSGIPAYQDLIRLIAYNQYGQHLPQTTFNIMENDRKIPFQIRLENGKGVVFTLRPLEDGQHYRIKVRAQSYDTGQGDIQYQTTFIIHIAVSAYPY